MLDISYARCCAYDMSTCLREAVRSERGQALGWRGWAIGDWGGWAIGDRGGRVSLHDKTIRKVRGH